MAIDTSNLKTFEDAKDALDEIDFPDDPNTYEDAQVIVQWVWDNCDRNNKDVVEMVFLSSVSPSGLEKLALEQLRRWAK